MGAVPRNIIRNYKAINSLIACSHAVAQGRPRQLDIGELNSVVKKHQRSVVDYVSFDVPRRHRRAASEAFPPCAASCWAMARSCGGGRAGAKFDIFAKIYRKAGVFLVGDRFVLAAFGTAGRAGFVKNPGKHLTLAV